MKITNLKELEERGILEHKDIVEFIVNKEIIKYKVEIQFAPAEFIYLNTMGSNLYTNIEIFDILKLDKEKIATKIYGYKPLYSNGINERSWPETKDNDYPALTILVKELYLIIEEKETVFTKFTRFEIMEI